MGKNSKEQNEIKAKIKSKEYTLVRFDGSASCWTHFFKIQKPDGQYLDYIYAPTCKTLYSYKSGGTSTANKHVNNRACCFLQQKHQEAKKKAKAAGEDELPDGPLKRFIVRPIAQSTKTRMNDETAAFVARAGLPARFVENDGLAHFLDAFVEVIRKHPGASSKDFLCSRNTITNRISLQFKAAKKKLAPILKEAEDAKCLHYTLDLGTEEFTHVAFIAVCAHFIFRGKLYDVPLATMKFEDAVDAAPEACFSDDVTT